MKRKCVSFIIFWMVCAAGCFAQTGGTAGPLTWSLSSDGTTLTISGSGDMPYYFSSDFPWYTYRSSIKSVIIEDGVTSIAQSAFEGCLSLTSITIPESVTGIGGYAFVGCSSLASINVNSKNTAYSSENGVLFDKNKTTLICHPEGKGGNYVIPASVTSIGYGAFRDCSSLTSITIPESVTNIGMSAFYYCTSLTSITIPESVTSIGELTFQGCSSLTSITIPEGVTSIEDLTFQGCSSLISITIPEGVMNIESAAFSGCSSLTSITIPEGVTSIENAAFSGCSSLTSITIPKNVTSIGYGAFRYCSSLTSIIIPASVTSIGSEAFIGCSSLTSIINLNPKPVSISIDYNIFYNVNRNTATLTVPTSAVSAYQNAEVWKEFNIVGGEILVTATVNNSEYGHCSGSSLYESGTSVTLTASPKLNGAFTGWTDGNTDNPRTITVTRDSSFTANFVSVFDLLTQIAKLEADTAALNSQIKTLTDDLNDCEEDKINLQALLDECLSEQSADAESLRSAPQLIVYPNPVSPNGVLNIANESLKIGDKMEIFDMNGKLISVNFAAGAENTLPIGALPQGMYLLRLAGKSGVKFEVR